MREILFRGKLATGKWAYGNLDVKKNGVCIITPGDTPLGCYGQVDHETVGQFTGLVDKKSQKIFEGDYIRAVLPPSKSQREFVWAIMPVVCSRGAFGLEDSHGEVTPLCGFAPYVTFEIVGNIHDGTQKEESK